MESRETETESAASVNNANLEKEITVKSYAQRQNEYRKRKKIQNQLQSAKKIPKTNAQCQQQFRQNQKEKLQQNDTLNLARKKQNAVRAKRYRDKLKLKKKRAELESVLSSKDGSLIEKITEDKLPCSFCDEKQFSNIYTRNRHVRNVHPESATSLPQRAKHIICPICTSEETFPRHKNFINHLTNIHEITIKESTLYFRNFEEFVVWLEMDDREVNYTALSRKKLSNGEEHIIYNCNRRYSLSENSNMKYVGSIHINGTCPSRFLVKILVNGEVMVAFFETHLGHPSELTIERSSQEEQNIIVGQDNKTSISFEERREIALEEICSFGRSLDENVLDFFIAEFRNIKNTIEQISESTTNKSIIEDQNIILIKHE